MRVHTREGAAGKKFAVYDPRGGGNIHIDRALTQISIAYPNNEFVGPILFPQVNVVKQSDLFYVFGREGWAPEVTDLRAPGTVANEIPGMAVSTTPYFAQEHSLQIAVTDEERENADAPFAPDRDGTELVTSKIWLTRELAIQALATTAANYATGYSVTLAGGQQWSDYVNSNPISDLKTGKRKVHSGLFMETNTAIIPYQVMTQLEDHPDFIERIKYSQPGVVTGDIIAAMVGLGNVVVPGVGYNSANPGQTASLGYLWAKDVILAWVPPRPAMRTPAYGYEFVWGYPGAQVTERWREEQRKSDIIRVSRRYSLKMTALDGSGKQIAGYLIKAAVA
jgi:hypothetical protein